jgi:hypothetical protein
VTDWATTSALATAGGTLVLAVATFASVRSANRSAQAAERSVLAGLRPLLVSSRPQDLEQKVGFADRHYVRVPGGGGTAEATDEAVYLTMSLRNVGEGVAVLHGWTVRPDFELGSVGTRPDLDEFRRLSRDIYVPAGDVGFWQGAIRDPAGDDYTATRKAIEGRRPIAVLLLYGDVEGGQRVVSLFTMQPVGETGWLATVSRHWNIDRPDPR